MYVSKYRLRYDKLYYIIINNLINRKRTLSENSKPFRVLSIDGGGMRGLYSAVLLDTLVKRLRGKADIDVGKGFDLIVGTSTGGILAVALAYGVPLQKIIDLYTTEGEQIFSNPMPKKKNGLFALYSPLSFISWILKRSKAAENGRNNLREALYKQFGNNTIGKLYKDREISLCVPAVRMSSKQSWVFKTPHLEHSTGHKKNRDNNYKLIDICLATSAAPILLPLAAIDNPDDNNRYDVFADGGLWANNPTLVGMIEALEITKSEKEIQIVSISTASPPSGATIKKSDVNFGLIDWKAGMGVLEASLDSQSSGTAYMAKLIEPHLKAKVDIIRLAHSSPSDQQVMHVGLDRANKEAITALTDMGKTDAENILSIAASKADKAMLISIIEDMPLMEDN